MARIQERKGLEAKGLDFEARILDRGRGLDSLDVAEVLAKIEERFNVSAFSNDRVIETWSDLVEHIGERSK